MRGLQRWAVSLWLTGVQTLLGHFSAGRVTWGLTALLLLFHLLNWASGVQCAPDGVREC